MVSGGLNGGRLYLGKKELTCSTELFMMGITGSRLVKASTHVIVKWVAPLTEDVALLRSTCWQLTGALSLQNLNGAGQLPVFGLGA